MGTFARVWLVRLKHAKEEDRNKVYALKVLRKSEGKLFDATKKGNFLLMTTIVVKLKQVEHVRNERNVLAAVAGHSFIITLIASFQDHDTLYMLVSYTFKYVLGFAQYSSAGLLSWW